jgi:hypothetical protein
VVANLGRDWQSVNKQCTEFIWRGSVSKKLNKVEDKEQYHVEISNRFTAFYTKVDIRAWEAIRVNIKISARESLGYYELKKHNPWMDEECS